MSLHSQTTCAVERKISGLEAESVSVNVGDACVDMVRAKSSQSRIESREHGPGIRAFPGKEILFPNFQGAAVKDQESTRVDDPYYGSCYHKAGRAIARIAHFLLLKKKAFEKRRHVAQDDLAGCAVGNN